MNNKNKNKTKTKDSAVCNDGVKRVLYKGDNGSFFVKMKGNDDRMMFVPFTKQKNVKKQNGSGWGICRNGSCNANAPKIRQPNVPQVQDEYRTKEDEDEIVLFQSLQEFTTLTQTQQKRYNLLLQKLDKNEQEEYLSQHQQHSYDYRTQDEEDEFNNLQKEYSTKRKQGKTLTKYQTYRYNILIKKVRPVPSNTRNIIEEEEYYNLKERDDYIKLIGEEDARYDFLSNLKSYPYLT